jgi:hypothetical protein
MSETMLFQDLPDDALIGLQQSLGALKLMDEMVKITLTCRRLYRVLNGKQLFISEAVNQPFRGRKDPFTEKDFLQRALLGNADSTIIRPAIEAYNAMLPAALGVRDHSRKTHDIGLDCHEK